MINQLVKTRPPECRHAADTCANVIRSYLLTPGRPFYSDLQRMTDAIEWVIETSDNPIIACWAYACRHAIPASSGGPAQGAHFARAIFPMLGFTPAETDLAVGWLNDKDRESFEAQVFFDADARWLLLQPAVVTGLAKKLAAELGKDKFSQWIDDHFLGAAIFYTKELKEKELEASSALSILREVAL